MRFELHTDWRSRWDGARGFIARACLRGNRGLSIEQVEQLLDCPTDRFRLMTITRDGELIGAAVLEAGDPMFIVAMGWRDIAQHELSPLDQFLEMLASGLGARRIMAVGRKGWPRFLRRFGYMDDGDGYIVRHVRVGG